MGQLTEKSS